MSQTIAEKILAEKSHSEDVEPGDHVVCDVDVAMTQDVHTPAVFRKLKSMEVSKVWDPSRVVVVFDHMAPSHSIDDADTKARLRTVIDEYDVEHFYDVGTGISHLLLPENGHVRPGDIVVGTDSHTITHGAFGAAGTGIGDTDMAYALSTGTVWFRVPETVRFHVTGRFGSRISTKDLVLSLVAEHGLDVAQYRSIEFTGPAIEALPLDDRLTLSNMSVELGGKFGFTPVDDRVVEYVEERTDESCSTVRSDPDATYEKVFEHDVSDLEPQVARPHDVDNVDPISAVAGIDVDQVFLGTCTHGTFDDLQAAAELLSGRTVDPGTRMIVTPASREIYRRATDEGLVDTFTRAGATVTNPTCGACLGLGMGVLGEGETCLAAQNRNYRGRMGNDSSEIYLASPETAAATALSGHIADPREV